MRYLLRTNTGYKHLPKKFEQTVLTYIGRDSSQWQFVNEVFLFVSSFSASENGLYELVNMFCRVGPVLLFFILLNVGVLLNEFLNSKT